MLGEVLAVYYEVQSVGKRIKSSKKRYIWKISINKQRVEIELFVSKFSGKKTLKINESIKFAGKKLPQYPITILDSFSLSLQQSGRLYDLYINSIAFGKLSTNLSSLDIPNIKIQRDLHWELMAKPYREAKRVIMSKRETLNIKPFRKIQVSEIPAVQSCNLCVPYIKPRSSSLKLISE